MNSWKTTALAILAGVGILIVQATALLDSDPNTVMQWDQVTTALGVFGIGWFARDNDKSSEDAGAK